MNYFKNERKAFTLIETLFALSIVSVSLLLLTSSLNILKKSYDIENLHQYQIAVSQLRLRLAPLIEFTINDDSITFDSSGEERVLYLHNNRIVESPGFIIYADQVEELNFILVENCISMEFTVGGKQHEALIYCK